MKMIWDREILVNCEASLKSSKYSCKRGSLLDSQKPQLFHEGSDVLMSLICHRLQLCSLRPYGPLEDFLASCLCQTIPTESTKKSNKIYFDKETSKTESELLCHRGRKVLWVHKRLREGQAAPFLLQVTRSLVSISTVKALQFLLPADKEHKRGATAIG